MTTKAPGKSFRKGLTLIEVMDMFPDEATATEWIESVVWPTGRCCGKCGATNTAEVPNARPMPYWCPDCRSYFSVRTGTALSHTRVPLRKWAIAIYLELTSLKGVSSMRLHRDIGVSQPTAWFMLHRIREAFVTNGPKFSGPVEVDETHIGGKRGNMSKSKRASLAHTGRGATHMTTVVGAKDRDTNQSDRRSRRGDQKPTLHAFIAERTASGATVYTDEAAAYRGMPFHHEAVNHKVAEYVRDQAHTNGIERFWAMLKRDHTGTFHKMSPKHLERYVRQFVGKHNLREADTLDIMRNVAAGLIGRRLMYRNLVSDNGLPSGARS